MPFGGELRIDGVLRSSLPASIAQATAKIVHLGDTLLPRLLYCWCVGDGPRNIPCTDPAGLIFGALAEEPGKPFAAKQWPQGKEGPEQDP
jgi:hypothetical protein